MPSVLNALALRKTMCRHRSNHLYSIKDFALLSNKSVFVVVVVFVMSYKIVQFM